MTCNCFAYQHLLTLVVPAVCFHCGSGLMSYSRLSDLRTPRYCFPLVSACVHPPSQEINNSTVQFIFSVKHTAFEESHPSRCVLKPPSFLFSRRSHFECCNQLCVSSLKPVRLPRQFFLSSCYHFVGPPFRTVTGGSKHTEVCIDFITAAQNFPRLTRCCFSVVCVNIALQPEV